MNWKQKQTIQGFLQCFYLFTVSAPHGFETTDILEPVAPPFSSLEPLEEVVTDGLKPTAQPTAPPTEVDEEK